MGNPFHKQLQRELRPIDSELFDQSVKEFLYPIFRFLFGQNHLLTKNCNLDIIILPNSTSFNKKQQKDRF